MTDTFVLTDELRGKLRPRLVGALHDVTVRQLERLTIAEFASRYEAGPSAVRQLIRRGISFNDIPAGDVTLHVAHLSIQPVLFQKLVRLRIHWIYDLLELLPQPDGILAQEFDSDELAAIRGAFENFQANWPRVLHPRSGPV